MNKISEETEKKVKWMNQQYEKYFDNLDEVVLPNIVLPPNENSHKFTVFDTGRVVYKKSTGL